MCCCACINVMLGVTRAAHGMGKKSTDEYPKRKRTALGFDMQLRRSDGLTGHDKYRDADADNGVGEEERVAGKGNVREGGQSERANMAGACMPTLENTRARSEHGSKATLSGALDCGESDEIT